ncbi:hypothetical protein RFI_17090 [Reticulomyxa filosa]|uniref:Uncharacterized protein n=1 Tax=Reticulomyxa filosa TaxID=46433 RepID=X6N486_RETFI|nr:hypothetical protein RFI_17090 [Reticulomyxa filosa]|eukprot:ETO20127.1 hypothetical protein RFI_17090 [Reticulomyxa filosa]
MSLLHAHFILIYLHVFILGTVTTHSTGGQQCTKLMWILSPNNVYPNIKEGDDDCDDQMSRILFPILHPQKSKYQHKLVKWFPLKFEEWFNVRDCVEWSLDIALRGDNVNNNTKDPKQTQVYLVVGLSTGNVILYQSSIMEMLVRGSKNAAKFEGQIVSRTYPPMLDALPQNQKICLGGPFVGVSQSSPTKTKLTENKTNDHLQFNPCTIDTKNLPFFDQWISVRKVKINKCCQQYLEIASGGNNGILRLQTFDLHTNVIT